MGQVELLVLCNVLFEEWPNELGKCIRHTWLWISWWAESCIRWIWVAQTVLRRQFDWFAMRSWVSCTDFSQFELYLIQAVLLWISLHWWGLGISISASCRWIGSLLLFPLISITRSQYSVCWIAIVELPPSLIPVISSSIAHLSLSRSKVKCSLP